VAEIEIALGVPINHVKRADEKKAMPSPGMMERHYAPNVPLECFERGGLPSREQLGENIGVLAFGPSMAGNLPFTIEMPTDVSGYSALLYDALHRMEDRGVARIVVELPPDLPQWLAVQDRLRRASWRA
jgi:L-threonylcarbamoyladenylate synthase